MNTGLNLRFSQKNGKSQDISQVQYRFYFGQMTANYVTLY